MTKEGWKLQTRRLQFTKGLDYKSSGSVSICGPGKYQFLGLNINAYVLTQALGFWKWVPCTSSFIDLPVVPKLTL